MNSEKFVPQRVRGNVEELDLALHADAKAGVVNLAAGEAGLAQQRIELDPGRPRAHAREPGQDARSAWQCAEPLGLGFAHRCNPPGYRVRLW